MKIALHYFDKISDATEIAIASERVHHRTNTPIHRPDPLKFEVERIECVLHHDYGDSLNRLWKQGEGFINLEHDVAPWPGALTFLWDCESNCCMYPILVHGSMNITNFACIKFSSMLINMTQGLWDRYPRNEVFDWRSLDGYFHQAMKERYDLPVHVHKPAVLHCNWSHL